MKKIAFFNVKGGVGKTTSAVNIAWLAAQGGMPTLLWDLDPQSCASWYLGIDDDAVDKKSINIFKGKTPVGRLRLHTAHSRLSVIPADLSLRKLELLLAQEAKSDQLLARLTDHLSERQQLIVYDCAPAYSQLSESLFASCDLLAVPLLPSPLSVRSYQQLTAFLQKKKRWKKLQTLPFFTMVDRRRKIHNDVIEHAKSIIGDDDPVIIPYASEYEKMGIHRAPIHAFAPSSKSAKAYEALWQRLQHQLVKTTVRS
ncbi:MAG: ParA family protein [Pseudomonadota bacterium]|nr:chromosome partitioning protein ParA [Pseudomonadales bacterium]MDY6920181.1 ParA family protein [Pseudomonadota bacterium]